MDDSKATQRILIDNIISIKMIVQWTRGTTNQDSIPGTTLSTLSSTRSDP